MALCCKPSPVTQWVKNPPAIQKTQVQSLGQEDPLEKEMATCSDILAWEIPWTEDPGGLQFMGLQRVGYDLVIKHTHTHTKLFMSCFSVYKAS